MADREPIIPYASQPAPPRARVHPIVWWFIADGIILFCGLVAMVAAYHELPIGQSPSPAMDALVSVLLFGSLGLLLVLLGWLVVIRLRQHHRG